MKGGEWKLTSVPKSSSNQPEPSASPAGSGAAVESVPKATPGKRRTFTAAEKQRLLKAASAAIASGERGALEAMLRKEGIYSSHLSSWRKQLEARGNAGLSPQKPGRKPKLDEKDRQLLTVTKENAALKRRLRIADALIALQKKAHEVLGIALPEFDEESS